ncbi:hypothetical protein ATZ33_13425 [Enterococcus silesiacus]|uniref:ABC transporter domain-containing protein n=1 Tax=Enterococcus silesiacus TaxID=332949 RepID=A0A0S3KDG0_9ENTE|nr:ABC transporter ATP-binding protein [Enterococcus silesiacus]ALS02349.1 hypothetical protein ATZ33_13425 [Enterococcus silesiacus]OJG91323.1 hypothetical protein RV15_GL000779 [Enterococcus silesiacus]
MITFYLENKKYQNNFEIKNISLEIHQGKCTALIGHNGSGKTTILNSLLGHLQYKGVLEVDDRILHIQEKNSDFDCLKSKIAYISDEALLFDFLTIDEYFNLIQKNSFNKIDIQYIELLIDIFKIQKYRNTLIEDLSFGTKKKVQIIAQLAKKTNYIVFDEPTNGLDPDMIIILKKLIHKLLAENIGVLISTHQLKFCEDLSDEIVIIQNGECILNDTTSSIYEMYDTHDLEEIYTSLNSDLYEKVGEYIETIQY